MNSAGSTKTTFATGVQTLARPWGTLMRRFTPLLLMLVIVIATHPAMPAETPLSAPARDAVSGGSREWRFRVYLGDKEIGYHHFFIADQGETQSVRSVADFDYKLLFVKLYEYRHRNLELWQGDCLLSIESSTDANGRPFTVSGQRLAEGFVVRANAGEAALPVCVMSFAYWNPRFLEQQQLLNSQNGEYLQVEISGPVADALEVRGELRKAWRYRLDAGKLNLALWYSEEQQWLGLESTTDGGRILRYELL